METRREQKARRSLVVGDGSRGHILPPVQDFVTFCLESPFLSTAVCVSNRHFVSLWLGYDPFHMYVSLHTVRLR